MSRKQEQVQIRNCEICGKAIVRPRYISGLLEPIAQTKKRKFCGLSCYETKVRQSPVKYWLGKKSPEETCEKVSLSLLGNKRAFGKRWEVPSRRNPDKTEHLRIRESHDMKIWKKKIFLRDNFTCKMCGKRGGKLHIDHIQPFSLFPNLRFELSNGRVLCVPCHRQTPTYGGRVLTSLKLKLKQKANAIMPQYHIG